MINFRFHLISLVAVFLALGIGVAAGASFIDRATVESLQGRIEDLDGAYRSRGAELDATREQLAVADRQSSALAGDQSYALEGRLGDQAVVLVVSDGVPAELLSSIRTTLAAAGVDDPAVVRILPAADFDDEGTVDRVADALGVEVDDGAALRRRVVSGLGASLAALSGPAGPGTASTVPARPATVPADAAASIEYLRVLDAEGVIAVESPDGVSQAAFGGSAGARFLEVISVSDVVSTELVMVPLAESVANWAPATMTVAFAGPARADGSPATTTPSTPGVEPSDPTASLRSAPTAERLSTVDDLEESNGRIAAVYSIAAQRVSGTVGAFGVGPDAVAPFPTVPPG
jgi:hypothetical protein